ncbi:helix-turn-helix domain-containing protein [Agrobacterium vitis]|uniref:Helix-turn-helix domain-containing protein n=1 Tax=Agrobacterium vitis TaxID=373 RepID=A0ABD6GCA3_AGRVI|nr:helix-turn-helix domain-containing protein [Agrobacterium vitis]MUO81385.1 helix-turn-helix domain-containing protein [Agrobacterium vitis]MUO96126.1 helix-turn-helix domain-containing protein [Agrobacterium vitis]MUP07065.1 helix-turn-helix domain-containing protein [Agrobacterium vitis]MUZ84795.1 helix-turn-helix domain-containing protein [Agrobacterium vitis]MVA12422.1 helix-turn-helix domain-containing protein [Agrobacterium vitis]
MTPFGDAVRGLRERKGVSQKDMAKAIGVTPAYLSALEHGRRGKPSFDLLQRIAGYFNIIWDEADDLFAIAGLSHPRVTVDTAGLPAAHTAFANRLAGMIRTLSPDVIEDLNALLSRSERDRQNPGNPVEAC